MLPAQPNKSVLDAVDVILAVAGSEGGIGSRELARLLAMEPTRTNRLLKTLAAAGLARQGSDGRYRSGPGMHVLSAMSLHASSLLPDARPVLEELGELGHTVALGVLWRDKVAYLYHWMPGHGFLEAVGRIGLYDATRSSIGMVLLASRSSEEVEALFPPHTAVPGFDSRSAFVAALEHARSTGIAIVRTTETTSTRAAAIGTATETPYAAVAVSGEIGPEEEESVTAAVRRAADRISATQHQAHP